MVSRRIFFWVNLTVLLCLHSVQATQNTLPNNSDYRERMEASEKRQRFFYNDVYKAIGARRNNIKNTLEKINNSLEIHKDHLPNSFTKDGVSNLFPSKEIPSLEQLIASAKPLEQYFAEQSYNIYTFINCEHNNRPEGLVKLTQSLGEFNNFWREYSDCAANSINILHDTVMLAQKIDLGRLPSCLLYRFSMKGISSSLPTPKPPEWDEILEIIELCAPTPSLEEQFSLNSRDSSECIKEILLRKKLNELKSIIPFLSPIIDPQEIKNSVARVNKNIGILKKWQHIKIFTKKIDKLKKDYEGLWKTICNLGEEERRKFILPPVAIQFLGSSDLHVTPDKAYLLGGCDSQLSTKGHYTFGIPPNIINNDNLGTQTMKIADIAISLPKLAYLNLGYREFYRTLQTLFLSPQKSSGALLPFSLASNCLILKDLYLVTAKPDSEKAINVYNNAKKPGALKDKLSTLNHKYSWDSNEFAVQKINKFVITSENKEGTPFCEYLAKVIQKKESLSPFQNQFTWQAILDLLTYSSAYPEDFVVSIDQETEKYSLNRTNENRMFFPPFTQISAIPNAQINTDKPYHKISQGNFFFLLAQNEIPECITQHLCHCTPLLLFNFLSKLYEKEKIFDSYSRDPQLKATHIENEDGTKKVSVAQALGVNMQINAQICQQVLKNISILIELVSKGKITWSGLFQSINPILHESHQELRSYLKENNFLDYLRGKITRMQESDLKESNPIMELAWGQTGKYENYAAALNDLPKILLNYIEKLQDQQKITFDELISCIKKEQQQNIPSDFKIFSDRLGKPFYRFECLLRKADRDYDEKFHSTLLENKKDISDLLQKKRLVELFNYLPDNIKSYFMTEWETAEKTDAFRAWMTVNAMDKLCDEENPAIYELLTGKNQSFDDIPCVDGTKYNGGKLLEFTSWLQDNETWNIKDWVVHAIQNLDLTNMPPELITEVLTVIIENFPEEAKMHWGPSWKQNNLLAKVTAAGAPTCVQEFLKTHCGFKQEVLIQGSNKVVDILPKQPSKQSTNYLYNKLQARIDHVKTIRARLEIAIEKPDQNTQEFEIAVFKQALECIKYPHELLDLPKFNLSPKDIDFSSFDRFPGSIECLQFLREQKLLEELKGNLNSLIEEYQNFPMNVLGVDQRKNEITIKNKEPEPTVFSKKSKSPKDCKNGIQNFSNSLVDQKLTLIEPPIQTNNNWIIRLDIAQAIAENSLTAVKDNQPGLSFTPLTPIVGEEYAHKVMQCLLQGVSIPDLPHWLAITIPNKQTTFYNVKEVHNSEQPALTPFELLADFLLLPKTPGSIGFSHHKESKNGPVKRDFMGEHIFPPLRAHLASKLMDKLIDRETRWRMLQIDWKALSRQWLQAIEAYNEFLPKDRPKDQQWQLEFHPWFIETYKQNGQSLQKILAEKLDLTYAELFGGIWPHLYAYIQYHKTHHPNTALSTLTRAAHFEEDNLDPDQKIAPNQRLFQALDKIDKQDIEYNNKNPMTMKQAISFIDR